MNRYRSRVALVAVVAWASSVSAQDDAALSNGTGAPVGAVRSMRDHHAMKRGVFTRLFMDTYLAGEHRDDAWDDDAVKALELYLDRTCGVQVKMPGITQAHLTEGIVEAGCQDPRLQYIHAYTHFENHPDVDEVLDASIQGFEREGGPAYCAHIAAARMATFLHDNKRADEAIHYSEMSLDWIRKSIERGELRGEEIRLLYDDIRAEIFRLPDRTYVRDWIEGVASVPGVDPWLVEMMYAYLEFRLGWDERGDGFAGTVTEEGWEKLTAHHNEAYFRFRTAYELAPHRPESATMLIDVAIGGHSLRAQDPTYWFERAVAAQPDWMPAYRLQLHGLRPRWHGTYEDMYELGLRAKRTGLYESNTPLFLVDVLEQIALDSESLGFWAVEGVYDEVAEVLEYYAANTPRRFDLVSPRGYYATLQLIFAWQAGKYDEAQRVRESMGRINFQALEKLDLVTRAREIQEDIYAYSSGIGDLMRDADLALEYGNVHDALDHYRMAAAQYDESVDPRLGKVTPERFDITRPRDPDHVARDRAAMLELYLAVQDGDWVDLHFDETLSGWWADRGLAKRIDDRTIELIARREGIHLFHRAPIGRRWEMRGEIDLSGAVHRNWSTHAGILVSATPEYPRPDFQQIGFYPKRDQVRLRRRRFDSRKLEVPIEEHFTFHVQLWDDVLAATIDDQLVFAGRLPADGSTWWPGPYFGLGGHYSWGSSDIIYRNLSIRLLERSPELLRDVLESPDEVSD